MTTSPTDILSWQRTVAHLDLLTAAEKAVAFALSLRISSRTGTAFPSLQTLADDVGQSLSVAKRAIRKLVQAGLVAIRRTGRSSIYRLLRWASADPSDRPAAAPKSTKVSSEVSPQPPGEQRADSPSEQPPPEPATQTGTTAATEAHPKPEIAAQARTEPAAADPTADIANHFSQSTGIDCTGHRHLKAIRRALRTHTPEQIKQAATHCAATWSNRSWATPSAVLKRGRVDEVLAQAKAAAATRAACHKPFAPEPPARALTPQQRTAGLRALAAVRAALGGSAA